MISLSKSCFLHNISLQGLLICNCLDFFMLARSIFYKGIIGLPQSSQRRHKEH